MYNGFMDVVIQLSISSFHFGALHCFRDFVAVCGLALDLNARLIGADQLEYQEALRINFQEMAGRLSTLFGEQVRNTNILNIYPHFLTCINK